MIMWQISADSRFTNVSHFIR